MDKFSQIETWYYDAILENNYSIVSLINVLTIGNWGIVLTGQFIYKNAKLLKSERKKYLLRQFYSSEEEPFIKINNKQIIKGVIDKNTGTWLYEISMGDQENGFDLEFIKTTTPWKGKTYIGNWLVIPRFEVNGIIRFNGKNIDVKGVGYHDHNIYPLYAPFVTRGYHFGKINIDSMTITWARVMKNRGEEQVIVVFNKNGDFININPKNIYFNIEKQVKNHSKLIPESFSLRVEDDYLNLNVKMDVLNFHHIGMPMLNYWRYHLKNIGEMQIGSDSYKIDCIEISEYLKFL